MNNPSRGTFRDGQDEGPFKCNHCRKRIDMKMFDRRLHDQLNSPSPEHLTNEDRELVKRLIRGSEKEIRAEFKNRLHSTNYGTDRSVLAIRPALQSSR